MWKYLNHNYSRARFYGSKFHSTYIPILPVITLRQTGANTISCISKTISFSKFSECWYDRGSQLFLILEKKSRNLLPKDRKLSICLAKLIKLFPAGIFYNFFFCLCQLSKVAKMNTPMDKTGRTTKTMKLVTRAPRLGLPGARLIPLPSAFLT